MAIRQQLVRIESPGPVLQGALFSPDSAAQHPLVIVCHGMPAGPAPTANPAPDADDGISYPDFAAVCAERGIAALIFNFRGTGTSGGNLHAMGWADDLRRVVDWVSELPEVRADHIGVLGSSMGASVAIHVAASEPRISAVVAFAAAARMGSSGDAQGMVARMREIGVIRDADYPPSVDDWYAEFAALDPLSAVSSISPRPTVLIQGDADDVVSPDDARLLFQRAGDPKELAILPGVGHRFRREPAAVESCIAALEGTLLP